MTNEEAKAKLESLDTITARSVLRWLNNNAEAEKRFAPTAIASMRTADTKTAIMTYKPDKRIAAITEVTSGAPAPKRVPAKTKAAPAAAAAADDGLGDVAEVHEAAPVKSGKAGDRKELERLAAEIQAWYADDIAGRLAGLVMKHLASVTGRLASIEARLAELEAAEISRL